MLYLILLLALIGFHIPRQTNRVHLGHGMDQWLGDCPRAIRWTALHRRPGQRYIDINFQTCLDDLMALHSGTAAENGYHYIRIKSRLRRRAMTHEELHRPIGQWHSSAVVRWYRTPARGRSYESKVHPRRFRFMVRLCKVLAVTMCPEVKSRAFAKEPHWAKQMKREADAVKATVYPMTLLTMKGWGEKAKNFDEAGFEFAVLVHGCHKPADLDTWKPHISAYWGGWGHTQPAPATL